jgi:type VI protein secretion system component Hcp
MTEDKDTRQQTEEDAQEDLELTDEAADDVGGGAGATFSDLSIMKVIDKSTPSL